MVDEPVQLNGDRPTNGAILDHLIDQGRCCFLAAHAGIGQPAARIAPRAFGPRTRMSEPSNTASSGAPRPAASAASNQPRHAVGRRRQEHVGAVVMIALVSSISLESSAAGTMRRVGDDRIRRPRRSSAAIRSSDRRSDVTPIRNR